MDTDRVAMVSLRADGTPDQGEGFEVIGQSGSGDSPEPAVAKRKTRKAQS